MEQYIANTLKLIENDIPKDRKEILMLADFQDYRQRMSKNYIQFIDYLREFSQKYKIIYAGYGIPNFKQGYSIFQLIKMYCKTDNPILYVCDIRGLNLARNIDTYEKALKIFDFEDVMGKVDIIVNNVNRHGYDLVLYKNDCSDVEMIKNNCPGIKFARYDHYIDDDIFRDYGLEKIYDIICFGTVDYGCYPFRKRLFELVQKSGKFNIKMVEHPGYGTNRKHNIINGELSKLLNQSKICIVTPSTLEFMLKKYSEAALSKCCMAGRIPKYNGEKYDGALIELNEKMTDAEIVDKLQKYLDNYDKIKDLEDKAYKVAKDNYTFKTGLKHWENIIDEFRIKNNIDQTKITQIYISKDSLIKGIPELKLYMDRYEPTVFVHPSSVKDFNIIKNHKGFGVVIWNKNANIYEWPIKRILEYSPEELIINNNNINKLVYDYIYTNSEQIVNTINRFGNMDCIFVDKILYKFYKIFNMYNIRHISDNYELPVPAIDIKNINFGNPDFLLTSYYNIVGKKKYNISIILNTRNDNPDYLITCIKSIIYQNNVSIQLIISTVEGDISIDVRNLYFPTIDIYISPKNESPDYGYKCIYHQLNKALPYVKYEWFMYMSANNILLPNKLQNEIEKCLDNNKMICYSNYYVTDEYLHNRKIQPNIEFNYRKLCEENYITSRALIKSELLKQFVPIVDKYDGYGFWELYLRIYEKYGNVFIYNNEAQFIYRNVGNIKMNTNCKKKLLEEMNPIKLI